MPGSDFIIVGHPEFQMGKAQSLEEFLEAQLHEQRKVSPFNKAICFDKYIIFAVLLQ